MNLYEKVTNTIVAALERGTVPWRKPWDSGISLPINALSNRPYRGVNVFLLALSPYADHRWLTFNQVKERGGRVRQGEKSTTVVFWKRWELPAGDNVDSESRREVPLLRHYNVFNVEQCEDLGLPELYRPPDAQPKERIERAELIVRSVPKPPRVVKGASAWYRPSDDLVSMPALERFKTADAYYGTLFHEFGHSTGHEGRLARPGVRGDIRFGSGEYGKEELVAEMASAFCCATVSLDNSLLDDSASYIQGWLEVLRSDPKAVVIAAAQAQKAADYMRGITYGG